MPRMKVAHVVQSFALGSIERVMATLAEATRGAGHEAIAVAYRGDGPLRSELERAGVRTAVLNQDAAPSATAPLRLARVLSKEGIDLIHTHHLGPAIAARVAAGILGVPMLHTEHGVGLADAYRRRWLGAGLSQVAHVVAATPHVARVRCAQLGCRCPVIENGVPVPRPALPGEREARRSILGIPLDAFVVTSVARLSSEKNHRLLIDAIAGLPGARLLLIGDGPELDALVAHVDGKRCGDRVHFLGQLRDPSPWWCAADVAVSVCSTPGQPLALLEAMAAGVPVVATAVAGLEGLMEQGAGLLVPSAEVSALRSLLEALAADPVRRGQLAEAGRHHVATHHAVEQMCTRYLDLYARVLAGRGGVRRVA